MDSNKNKNQDLNQQNKPKQQDRQEGNQPKHQERLQGSQQKQQDRQHGNEPKQQDRQHGNQPKQQERQHGSQPKQQESYGSENLQHSKNPQQTQKSQNMPHGNQPMQKNMQKSQEQSSQHMEKSQNMPQSGHGTQSYLPLVRRLFDEVFNKGNVSVLDEFFSSNVKLHDPAHMHKNTGLSSLKEIETSYIKAFPNKKVKIDDIFLAEDKVVVRWTCTGVQKGPLQDIAASNKPFTMSGISIYTFANGKIAEIYQNWDRLALLEQIGEIQPAMALH